MPAHLQRIPVAQPVLGDYEIAELTDVIRSGRISSGAKVAAFENAVADYTGANHAIAVSTGTAALHVTLAALGVGAGDEVLVPDLTFISTAFVVLYQGATPVLCECDPSTYNVTAEILESRLTDRTRAMIPVEMNGIPLDYAEILPMAERAGVPMIIDSAESFGSEFAGQAIGNQALAHTWSFFPNKTVTTGEGGMVTTSDSSLASDIRSLLNQGQDGRYNHVALGFNYRMTEMQAAIGIAQMKRLPWILEEKERIAVAYDEAILGIPGLEPAPRPDYATQQSWFMYSVTCETRAIRDAMAGQMEEEGIETRTGFPPIHSQPYFREHFGYGEFDFPVTMATWERKLDIPCWAGMPEDTQSRVIDSMKRSRNSGRELT
jgi:perosamine synthetase